MILMNYRIVVRIREKFEVSVFSRDNE